MKAKKRGHRNTPRNEVVQEFHKTEWLGKASASPESPVWASPHDQGFFDSTHLAQLMAGPVVGFSPFPSEYVALPVDPDSGQPLLRIIDSVVLKTEPIYNRKVRDELAQLALEHEKLAELSLFGIAPTSKVLLTGLPGVGKTLAAQWLARELGKPLAVLNLGAVMSSYLGRTSENLRAALDFASSQNYLLLLDDFDALAKRRDAQGEGGELTRLVTVLIQELDQWPDKCLLIATTSQPNSLDRAVWRRFETRIELGLPEGNEIATFLCSSLSLPPESAWPNVLGQVMTGATLSEVFQVSCQVQRAAVLGEKTIESCLEMTVQETVSSLDRSKRKELAVLLTHSGLVSQRQACEITGVSRDTIRKSIRSVDGDSHGMFHSFEIGTKVGDESCVLRFEEEMHHVRFRANIKTKNPYER